MKQLEIDLPTRRSTLQLAKRLAQSCRPSDLLILSGALGAGKTFLVRGLARALGLPQRERVTSPTFALVQEYPTEPKLVHADLYRLSEPGQLVDLGLDSARADGHLLVVEWGEPFAEALGGDALCLHLDRGFTTDSQRKAMLTAGGTRSEAWLDEVASRWP